jgi:hypothetical protein
VRTNAIGGTLEEWAREPERRARRTFLGLSGDDGEDVRGGSRARPTVATGRCWVFPLNSPGGSSSVQISPPRAGQSECGRRDQELGSVGFARSPFFEDKNRAFWILQSAGWAGYFVLRTLSGIANAMEWSFAIHIALLTATGYSITLLMAAIYRRLIRVRPIVTWLTTIAILLSRPRLFRRSRLGATPPS